jgi:hypothetical protein
VLKAERRLDAEELHALLRQGTDLGRPPGSRLFGLAKLIVELEVLAADVSPESTLPLSFDALVDGCRQSRRIESEHVVWDLHGEDVQARPPTAEELERSTSWATQYRTDPGAIPWAHRPEREET